MSASLVSSASPAMTAASEQFTGAKNRITDFFNSGSIVSKIVLALIVIIAVMSLVRLIKSMYNSYQSWKDSSPYLVNGTKTGRTRQVIHQDPRKPGAITLPPSKNELGGIEFSYSFWILIDDMTYNYGKPKSVFHKGTPTGFPLRAPGVSIAPNTNTLQVYMNTYEDPNEMVEIENFPINKWVYVVIALRQKELDIYVNGNLAKRKQLDGLPKLNDGDVYISDQGGFSGFLSNLRYFNYYLAFSDMESEMSQGPSSKPCIDTNEMPPYLSNQWWLNQQ